MRKTSKILYVSISALVLILSIACGQALAYRELPDGLYAKLETNQGTMVFRLFPDEAPLTVANFIGLTEGLIEWKDANTGKWEKRPFYDGLSFYRLIPGLMIMTGDPEGNGHGGPGYCFKRECSPQLHHSEPGILSMLNQGTFSHGSRFFITLDAMPWLDGKHAVFGNLVRGRAVLSRLKEGDRIIHLTILRRGETAQQFDVREGIAALKRSAAAVAQALREQDKEEALTAWEQQCNKNIPEPKGEFDPAKIPCEDQKPTDQVALQYILLTYKGALSPSHYQRCTKDEARQAAHALVMLARTKGTDFEQLAIKYSDSPEYRIPFLRKDRVSESIFRVLFTLKEGQVSAPIDTPQGFMIFKRVRLDLIRVRHILISYKGARGSRQERTREQALQLAKSILKRAKTGEDFSLLAKRYSDSRSAKNGGLLPPLAPGMTMAVFELHAFALSPGQISGVISTPSGFQIIKRVE